MIDFKIICFFVHCVHLLRLYNLYYIKFTSSKSVGISTEEIKPPAITLTPDVKISKESKASLKSSSLLLEQKKLTFGCTKKIIIDLVYEWNEKIGQLICVIIS